MSTSTTVLLVDERHDVRGLLRAYLALNFRPQLLIAGEAVDGGEAVRMCDSLRPDVVVLSDDLPGMGGPAVPVIRRVSPATFIILRAGGRSAAAAHEPRLHAADRQVDRDEGLGPLGDALAEALRSIEMAREAAA